MNTAWRNQTRREDTLVDTTELSETSSTNKEIDLMIEGVSFRGVSRTSITDTRSGQTVIHGCDDQGVSDPDEASSGKSYQPKVIKP